MTHSHRPARSGPGARVAGLPALATALGLLGAAPAAAHSAKVLIKLRATPPGTTGGPTQVVAVATYVTDRHKASALVMTVSATQGAKRVATRLKPAGQGRYTGSLRLGPGRWKLTATATGESEGSGTADVTVAAPTTTAAPAMTVMAPVNAAAASGGASSTLPAIGLLAAVAAAGAVVFVLLRRRSRPRPGG
jgi:hypothetical protein